MPKLPPVTHPGNCGEDAGAAAPGNTLFCSKCALTLYLFSFLVWVLGASCQQVHYRRENEGLLGADVFAFQYHNAPKNPYCSCSIPRGPADYKKRDTCPPAVPKRSSGPRGRSPLTAMRNSPALCSPGADGRSSGLGTSQLCSGGCGGRNRRYLFDGPGPPAGPLGSSPWQGALGSPG